MAETLSGLIAARILDKFRTGLLIDDDARHFFRSCEGVAGDGEILSFLENRDLDSSPVYELIIYPDRSMRSEIESLIPARGLEPGEINNIIFIVESAANDIFVNSGDVRAVLPWSLFGAHAVQYIRRLNLDINADIFPFKNGNDFMNERILVRSGRLICRGETAEFLGTLAGRARERNIPDRAELFSFALDITRGKNEKVMELFENRKCFYESAIRESVEFSGIIGKYSMEFVMAKKIPVPLTGLDEASEAIRKIDAITSLVYGMIIPSIDHGVEMLLKDGGLTEIY